MIAADQPRRAVGVRQFSVKDEIILVSSSGPESADNEKVDHQAVTLNPSSSAVWALCDGKRSLDDIVAILNEQFPIDRDVMHQQVNQALSELARLGFVDRQASDSGGRTPTTFVIGIEDKPYFWWQTAIFLESFKGKIPPGWKTFVVVCNDGKPLSSDLQKILATYNTDFELGTNHADNYRIDVGNNGGEFHSALNRIEALSVAGSKIANSDVICLLDSDIFLYGDINYEIMPGECAMPRNWHIEKDPFFSSVDANNGKGIDLHKLLEAMGCERELEPGGVNVFITGKVAKNKKFIADCFRFAQALFLLGRAAGAKLTWIAEMPCFALALTANGIGYELREQKELLVSDCNEETIPAGTLYHYYSDPGDFGRAAFYSSKWHKQAYQNDDFLRTDLRQFSRDARTDHERYFFQLAKAARDRLDV